MQAKCLLHPLPFFLDETPSAPSVAQQLDAATAEAAARGIEVRGLLVTNPNNPLGTIYRRETVEGMVRWCLQNKVHYVRWERIPGRWPLSGDGSACCGARHATVPTPPETSGWCWHPAI